MASVGGVFIMRVNMVVIHRVHSFNIHHEFRLNLGLVRAVNVTLWQPPMHLLSWTIQKETRNKAAETIPVAAVKYLARKKHDPFLFPAVMEVRVEYFFTARRLKPVSSQLHCEDGPHQFHWDYVKGCIAQ